LRLLALLFVIPFLSNCAPRAALGPAFLAYPGERPISIELKSFSFHPDHILVLRNHHPLTFRLTNTADILHNFTLMGDRMIILLSIDIAPKESITVSIRSLDPGNYTFYCNRFFHRHKGMLMVD
jgi:plastocyanin